MRNFLLSIPTTKLRILISLGLTIWTAYAHLVNGKDVGYEWLGFLLLNSGIDIAQYSQNIKKRESLEGLATTDVREIVEKG